MGSKMDRILHSRCTMYIAMGQGHSEQKVSAKDTDSPGGEVANPAAGAGNIVANFRWQTSISMLAEVWVVE